MAIWKNICIHTHTPPRRLEAFHVRTHLVKKTSQMNTAAGKARQGTTRQGKSRQGKACARVLCKRLRILLPACNSCVTHNVLTYNPQQIQHNAEEKVLPTYYWLVHTVTMERQTHSETFFIEHNACLTQTLTVDRGPLLIRDTTCPPHLPRSPHQIACSSRKVILLFVVPAEWFPDNRQTKETRWSF